MSDVMEVLVEQIGPYGYPILQQRFTGAGTTCRIGRDLGCDVIVDDEHAAAEHAVLTLLEDGRVSVRDLVIAYGAGDVITVKAFFDGTANRIEQVVFSDATVHDVTYILLNTTAQTGTSGDDTLTGTPGQDILQGLGGNDTLIGLGDSDTLDGGAGIDAMTGGEGDDADITL